MQLSSQPENRNHVPHAPSVPNAISVPNGWDAVENCSLEMQWPCLPTTWPGAVWVPRQHKSLLCQCDQTLNFKMWHGWRLSIYASLQIHKQRVCGKCVSTLDLCNAKVRLEKSRTNSMGHSGKLAEGPWSSKPLPSRTGYLDTYWFIGRGFFRPLIFMIFQVESNNTVIQGWFRHVHWKSWETYSWQHMTYKMHSKIPGWCTEEGLGPK